MAAGSAARMLGPIAAGVTFTWLGPNAPFLTGAVLVVPAVLLALEAGRAFGRVQKERAPAALGPATSRAGA